MFRPVHEKCNRPGIAALTLLMLLLQGCQASGPNTASGKNQKGSRSFFRPKGAPWTILCLEMRGPSRMLHVQQIAETLKRSRGVRSQEVFVRDEDDGAARLYYGTYYRRTNPKTGKRSIPKKLVTDLEFIKQLGDSGQSFFLGARKVRMPLPNVGNPDWDLKNAEGVYTLQVAVFEPTDDFWDCKQAASEYCKYLRKQNLEAYFYHADASSMVTVGLFGEDALITQQKGLRRYSAKVKSLQKSNELLRYNRLNGAVYTAMSDKGQKVRVESRLVKIPGKDGSDQW